MSSVQTSAAMEYAPGDHWYVRRGRQVRGPFSSGRVRHLVVEGRLTLTDEVSQDKSAWRAIGAVAEVVPPQLRREDDPVAEDEARARQRDRRNAWLSVLIGLLLLGGAVSTVLLLDTADGQAEPDCLAKPAPQVQWRHCRFDRAQLGGVDLNGAYLASASLVNATLTRANLERAELRYANLAGADLAYARLDGADLTGANLRGADLTNADLRNTQLGFADLRGAVIGGAQFSGSQVARALWIDGRECGAEGGGNCP